MKKIGENRLLQVILAAVQSEKSTNLADKYRQVAFRVVRDANKHEIKAAVELLFKVQVKSVQIVNIPAKQKRVGRLNGWRKAWKKAYVCLQAGQQIDFASAQ